jgi:NTE family protein
MSLTGRISRNILTMLSGLVFVACMPADARSQSIDSTVAKTLSGGFRVEQRSLSPFSSLSLPRVLQPKIGLVLSGGGARGFSQIGILEALEDAGIVPDLIVGTSIGSIVGGLYAAGFGARNIADAVCSANWSNLLSLTDDVNRRNIFVDRKSSQDRSVFSLRLDGFKPVLPLYVSNGQRLSDMLNETVLQCPWHSTSFDSLKIPFRAVATDLYTGKRVVLSSGNLADALRASSTIPVLYAPIELDSMALVDGGLRSNLAVDIAREMGCDIVIAVNTTSPMRRRDQINNPFESLDQVLNVLMTRSTQDQMQNADIVFEPVGDEFLASDFEPLDTLIALGRHSVQRSLPVLLKLIDRKTRAVQYAPPELSRMMIVICNVRRPNDANVSFVSRQTGASFVDSLYSEAKKGVIDSVSWRISSGLDTLYTDVSCNPVVRNVQVHGAEIMPDSSIAKITGSLAGMHLCYDSTIAAGEAILKPYRQSGYSLARISDMRYDSGSSSLMIDVEEGRIDRIRVSGNVRTDTVVILRELPLSEGMVFRIGDARNGIARISGLNLFHHVSYEVNRINGGTEFVVHVDERSSRSLQAGILIDDERNGQLLAEFHDANFYGTGSDLSVAFFGGLKNRRVQLVYSTSRLFYTNLNLTAQAYHDLRDYSTYEDNPDVASDRFERISTGSYRRTVYGGSAQLGMYVERFGSLYGDIRYELHELQNLTGRNSPEKHRIVSLGIGTTIDTQDRFPYPCRGAFIDLSYRSAQSALGSEVSFTRFSVRYEFYLSSSNNMWTIHPKFLFGFGDKTMPKSEEFHFGGFSSFYGTRENMYSGQQIILGSMELRMQLPFQFLFNTFVSARYDLGRAWEQPEQIKFADLMHGIGFSLGLDTPIGPAEIGAGRSFIFPKTARDHVRWSPTYMYFSVGVGLP